MHDCDHNGIEDFWTGDVAGLYCIDGGDRSHDPIQLIEVSVALADLAPSPGLTVGGRNRYWDGVTLYGKPGPRAGYWYGALIEDLQANERYAQRTWATPEAKHNLHRFGVAAMPESSGPVYLITEGNTLWERHFEACVLRPGTSLPVPTRPFALHRPRNIALVAEWNRLE